MPASLGVQAMSALRSSTSQGQAGGGPSIGLLLAAEMARSRVIRRAQHLHSFFTWLTSSWCSPKRLKSHVSTPRGRHELRSGPPQCRLYAVPEVVKFKMACLAPTSRVQSADVSTPHKESQSHWRSYAFTPTDLAARTGSV